jgi:hypothetical protein
VRLTGAAACAFLAAWAYWPVMSHGFVNLEDYWLILDNPRLRELGAANLRWMFTSLDYGTYQPLGWLSYALIHRVQGYNPAAYHLASWLAHAACAALLCLVASRVLRAASPEASELDLALASAAAAAAWALHPQRVEQVAWATGLPDVLSTLCYLAAILAYLGVREDRRRAAAAFLLFLASSLFRWKGVGLPVVLVALDALVLKRPLKRGVWLEKLPFLALAALFAALNARSKLLLAPGHAFDARWHTLAGPVFYLWKMLLPFHLTVDYWIPESAALAAAFLALSAAVLAPRRWRATAGAAWACFVAAILPSLLMSYRGLVVAHDRAAYLPSMSLHVLLGGALLALLRAGPALRRTGLSAAAAALVLAAVFTRAQLPVWRDSVSLWLHVLDEPAPPDYAHLSLAQAWLERGDRKEAAAELREQLRLYPGDRRVEALSRELERR